MAPSVPQWDPAEVLQIEDIFTCSGWAHSKGRECYNRIAKENRELATDIMEDMAELDIRSADFRSSLKSLAKPLLCRAYHVKDPEQHTRVRRQWKQRIEAYKASLTTSRTQTRRTHTSRNETSHVQISRAQTSRAQGLITPPPSSATIESLQQELETMKATMAAMMQRSTLESRDEHIPSVSTHTSSARTTQVPQVSNHTASSVMIRAEDRQPRQSLGHGGEHITSSATTPSSANRPLIAEHHQHELQPSPASLPAVPRVTSDLDPYSGITAQDNLGQASHSEPLSPPVANSSRPESTIIHRGLEIHLRSAMSAAASEIALASDPDASVQDAAGRDHTHQTVPSGPIRTAVADQPSSTATESHPSQDTARGRKPVVGDCSICCEDLQTGGTLVWCKAQCGQNFHADCVGIWLATAPEYPGLGGRRSTCPYW